MSSSPLQGGKKKWKSELSKALVWGLCKGKLVLCFCCCLKQSAVGRNWILDKMLEPLNSLERNFCLVGGPVRMLVTWVLIGCDKCILCWCTVFLPRCTWRTIFWAAVIIVNYYWNWSVINYYSNWSFWANKLLIYICTGFLCVLMPDTGEKWVGAEVVLLSYSYFWRGV